jgi:hypothetical protein
MDASGQSVDGQIVHLEGITKCEFRLLLKVMIPASFWGQLMPEGNMDVDNAEQHLMPTSWQEWASVHRLSTMWEMERVRGNAIARIVRLHDSLDEWTTLLRWSTDCGVTELRDIAIRALRFRVNEIQGVEKLSLAREYKVGEWLLAGYMHFVERDGEILIEEEEHMGWERTSRLFRLRHRYLRGQIEHSGLKDIIRSEFRAEFDAARYVSCPQEANSTLSKRHLVSTKDLTGVCLVSFDSVTFRVRSFINDFGNPTNPKFCRWAIPYLKCLGFTSSRTLRFSRACSHSLTLMLQMDGVTINLYVLME